jgi:hypothetical protein
MYSALQKRVVTSTHGRSQVIITPHRNRSVFVAIVNLAVSIVVKLSTFQIVLEAPKLKKIETEKRTLKSKKCLSVA